MPSVFNLIKKPLGEVLEEAGLINEGQLKVVLMEQDIYDHLKFGEILALHGWLKQETADFFAEKMRQLIRKENFDLQIGNLLNQAGLLSEEDIRDILNEQKKTGVKFGSIAVLKGLIAKQTLDFFLKYLTLKAHEKSDFQYKDKDTLTQKRLSLQNKNNQANAIKVEGQCQTMTSYLATYYDLAKVYFAKVSSANNNSEKLEHLLAFLNLYQRIEELQAKNDPTIGKLARQAQEELDKMHVFALAELQRA